MKVIVIPVGQPARVAETEGQLEDFQAFVGGYVEVVLAVVFGEPVMGTMQVLGNEDGRIHHLPVNRIRHDGTVLVGPLVAANLVENRDGSMDWGGFSDAELPAALAAVEAALARPS